MPLIERFSSFLNIQIIINHGKMRNFWDLKLCLLKYVQHIAPFLGGSTILLHNNTVQMYRDVYYSRFLS